MCLSGGSSGLFVSLSVRLFVFFVRLFGCFGGLSGLAVWIGLAGLTGLPVWVGLAGSVIVRDLGEKTR